MKKCVIFSDAMAMYLTGRTEYKQIVWKERLDMKRKITDDTLYNLRVGAGDTAIGHSYRSPELLAHVINRYRHGSKITGEFMNDLQFYTDVIYDLTAGVGLNSPHLKRGNLWKWMTAYHRLMVTVNYLGVEQTLCSVLYSIICFSHRETFYYANLTYSAEAAFRDYQHVYPGDHGGDWRNTDRSRFLPNLTLCRREVFSDLYYQGMSIDPMKCDHSRRNETHFTEASQIIFKENHTIISYISLSLDTAITESYNTYMLYLMITGGIGCYFIVMHLLRCSCIKCIQRYRSPKRRLSEDETCIEPLAVKNRNLDEPSNHDPRNHNPRTLNPRNQDLRNHETRSHVTFADPIQTDHMIGNNSHHKVIVNHNRSSVAYRDLVPIKVATV